MDRRTDLNPTRIAGIIGVPRTTLTGWKRFAEMLKLARAKAGKAKIRRPRYRRTKDGFADSEATEDRFIDEKPGDGDD